MSRISRTLFPVSFLMALLLAGNAFADDCENLGSNQQWKDGLYEVKASLENGNYDAVLLKGEELSFICSRSPKLNYYIGSAYAAKNDFENAKVYFEIAGDSTYEFATTPELSKDIFYGRYEAEHPERTEAAVKALTDERDLYAQKVKALEEQQKSVKNGGEQNRNAADAEKNSNENQQENTSLLEQMSCRTLGAFDQIYDYGIPMWTGIGVALVGAVVTTVGGVLIAKMDKYEHTGYHEEVLNEREAAQYGRVAGLVNIQDYKVGGGYIAGWTLLGVGITATITGTILAGIYGYKLSHFDESYSFGIAPNGVSFGMTF